MLGTYTASNRNNPDNTLILKDIVAIERIIGTKELMFYKADAQGKLYVSNTLDIDSWKIQCEDTIKN